MISELSVSFIASKEPSPVHAHITDIQRCPLKSGSNLFADLVQTWQLLHWINHKLFVRLTVPKRLVSLFLFTQAFTEHWSDLPPASLNYHRIIIFIIMVLWHCINLITFIIMMMIIIISRWFLVCDKQFCARLDYVHYTGAPLFFNIDFPSLFHDQKWKSITSAQHIFLSKRHTTYECMPELVVTVAARIGQ